MSITENNKVNEYINDVCKLIKNKKVHNEIKEELLDHINDIIEDYLEIGMSLDVATDKALTQMGNAEIIGHDLNKAHKSNSDWLLLIITSSLIFFGFLTTAFLQLNNFNDNYYINYINKILVFLGISIILSLCLLKLDYRKLKKYSLILYIISISLILLTLIISLPIHGMKRWLTIGAFSIDTLSVTPILLIISLAGIVNSSFLPDANMEFALTSIIYCFGWIVGIIVIALVLSFIIRLAFISINTKNTYGKLLVSGLCSLFAVQFILNILANFSLSPILGINMPFISYGGNQLIINILSISIINNVYKFRNVSSN